MILETIHNESQETKFSIYKINPEKVKKKWKLSDVNSPDEIVNTIMTYCRDKIKSKNDSECSEILYGNFRGFIYKAENQPDWTGVLLDISSYNELENEPDFDLDFYRNVSVSYILFRVIDNCVFVMTGGYASSLIREFKESYFGLSFIPKLIKEDTPIIRSLSERNLTSNQTSAKRTNRNNTAFITEQDLSAIYTELAVEIDRSFAETLGIVFDATESIDKKIKFINKDSLVIQRALSLEQLDGVLNNLEKLEKAPDNFALNYFILANKEGYKQSDLFDTLTNKFLNNSYQDFILIGEDYTSYLLDVDNYIVRDHKNNIFLESDSAITIEEIYEKMLTEKKTLSKNYINNFLNKWTIETIERDRGSGIYTLKMREALQGSLDQDGTTFYLMNGEWYIFSLRYIEKLNESFQNIINYGTTALDTVVNTFKLKDNCENVTTETNYADNVLKVSSKIFFSDRALYTNIEISDAIFWNEKTIYLMHNKSDFNGSGARDLFGQIISSSELLKNMRASDSNHQFLSEYYNKIIATNYKDQTPIIREEEFVELFNSNRQICYIAGFVNNFAMDTKVNYGKFLIVDAYKRLIRNNHELLVMGIN